MQKLGGKHKRGARGSVEEEEPSTLKRANMAECQEEEAAELVEATNEAINAEGEPSNAELREMLVDSFIWGDVLHDWHHDEVDEVFQVFDCKLL